MKKIFAIYLRINLTQKPAWFDEFRKKNDGWFELHITLIQPRYISDEQTETLKTRVTDVLAQIELGKEDKKLFFNKLVFEKLSDEKYLFMWFLEKNSWLMQLQKELRTTLKNYDNYYDEVTKEYETNFRPHIVIVESINTNQKEKAKKYLSSDSILEGIVVDLALPIVKDMSKEERTDINNLTIFNL